MHCRQHCAKHVSVWAHWVLDSCIFWIKIRAIFHSYHHLLICVFLFIIYFILSKCFSIRLNFSILQFIFNFTLSIRIGVSICLNGIHNGERHSNQSQKYLNHSKIEMQRWQSSWFDIHSCMRCLAKSLSRYHNLNDIAIFAHLHKSPAKCNRWCNW